METWKPTYHKCISNDAWNGDATYEFKNHVNIDVGWETSTDTKQQQEEDGEQDDKTSTKPTNSEKESCYTDTFKKNETYKSFIHKIRGNF